MQMESASGYYLNAYHKRNGNADIFVIFNEPNSKPTAEELTILTALIEQKISESASMKDIRNAVEESDLECVEFGVQVFGRLK